MAARSRSTKPSHARTAVAAGSEAVAAAPAGATNNLSRPDFTPCGVSTDAVGFSLWDPRPILYDPSTPLAPRLQVSSYDQRLVGGVALPSRRHAADRPIRRR